MPWAISSTKKNSPASINHIFSKTFIKFKLVQQKRRRKLKQPANHPIYSWLFQIGNANSISPDAYRLCNLHVHKFYLINLLISKTQTLVSQHIDQKFNHHGCILLSYANNDNVKKHESKVVLYWRRINIENWKFTVVNWNMLCV